MGGPAQRAALADVGRPHGRRRPGPRAHSGHGRGAERGADDPGAARALHGGAGLPRPGGRRSAHGVHAGRLRAAAAAGAGLAAAAWPRAPRRPLAGGRPAVPSVAGTYVGRAEGTDCPVESGPVELVQQGRAVELVREGRLLFRWCWGRVSWPRSPPSSAMRPSRAGWTAPRSMRPTAPPRSTGPAGLEGSRPRRQQVPGLHVHAERQALTPGPLRPRAYARARSLRKASAEPTLP